MATIADMLDTYADNKLAIALAGAIAGAIVGAILTKILPGAWSLAGQFALWVGGKVGGRFAHAAFQGRYLDWVVVENRELKLTGIVSNDETKKPQLDQVFLSLRIARQREAATDSGAEAYGLKGYIKTWRELRDMLSFQEQQTRDRAERARMADFRKFAAKEEASIRNRAVDGIKHPTPDAESAARLEEDAVLDFLTRSPQASVLHNAIGNYQLCRLLREQSRIAILGVPGAGKTTLLQHIALAFGRERTGDRRLRQKGLAKKHLGCKQWRLPIVVRLSSVASLLAQRDDHGNDRSLLDVLPRILPPDLQKGGMANEYFTHQLQKGRCVVLLDGLDEVPTETEFAAVVTAIKSFILTYQNNLFIVTSRIAGWRGGIGPDFDVNYVDELSEPQITTFIDTWYQAVERNAVVGRLQDEGVAERTARERRSSAKANDLKATLQGNLGIRRLATNPMLLSIVAVVHRSLATLPKERSKLYSQCSKIFLEQWDISRGIRVDDTALKLEQKEAIMRRLAFAYHTGEIGDKGGGREASRREVEETIGLLLPGMGRDAKDADHLLRMLTERSGILTERRRDCLSFAHLTFQEYFAAQHLALGSGGAEFLVDKDRMLSDWWREVVLLFSGLLPDSGDFIERIDSSPNDDLVQHRLLLAALCLGESVSVARTEVRASILTRIQSVRSRGAVVPLSSDVADYLTQWARGQQWYSYAALSRAATVTQSGAHGALDGLLLSAMASPDARVREAALDAVAQLIPGTVSAAVVGAAMARLSDVHGGVRTHAVAVLSTMKGTVHADRIATEFARAIAGADGREAVQLAQGLGAVLVGAPMSEACREAVDTVLRGGVAAGAKRALLFALCADGNLPAGILIPQTAAGILSEVRTGPARHEDAGYQLLLGLLPVDIARHVRAIDELGQHVVNNGDAMGAASTCSLARLCRKGMSAEVGGIVDGLLASDESRARAAALAIIARSEGLLWSDARRAAVVAALSDGNASIREAGCHAARFILAGIDPDPSVVHRVVTLAQAEPQNVRVAALSALGVVSRSDLRASVVDAVLCQLSSTAPRIALAAAESLSQQSHGGLTVDQLESAVRAWEVLVGSRRSPWARLRERRQDGTHMVREFFERAVGCALLRAGATISCAHVFERVLRLLTQSGRLRWTPDRYRLLDGDETTVLDRAPSFQGGRMISYSEHSLFSETFFLGGRMTGYSEHSLMMKAFSFGDHVLANGDPETLIVAYAQRLPADWVEERFRQLMDDSHQGARDVALILVRGTTAPLSATSKAKLLEALCEKNRSHLVWALMAVEAVSKRAVDEDLRHAVEARLSDESADVRNVAWKAVCSLVPTAIRTTP